LAKLSHDNRGNVNVTLPLCVVLCNVANASLLAVSV
jgi:hypothetical protein